MRTLLVSCLPFSRFPVREKEREVRREVQTEVMLAKLANNTASRGMKVSL